MLLERERELLVIGEAVGRAMGGTGSILLFEGEHGSGKSALLGAGTDEAGEAGLLTLRGAGAELERDFPFGVALQLLEPVLDSDESAELFLGPASLARPLFDPRAGTLPPPERPEYSILHGLYWLTANLASRQPLLFAIDDAQWVDAPSLRFLLYLAKRLDELPVVVVLGAQTGAHGAENGLLGELTADFVTERLTLHGLNPEASEQLVRSIKEDAGGELCRACHDVTRGNPLFLSIVASELRDANGNGDSPERVRELGSEPIAERVLIRLERLGPDALALARATAVIGDEAPLRQVAELAELDLDTASTAADLLTAGQVLTKNGRLAFAHPIVRNSVLASMEPAERSRLRLAAARVLVAEGAPPERVASHLLEAQEQATPWVVDTLVEAAERSLDRGAPESAVSYLRRALAEPPPEQARHKVQVLLGRAEAVIGEPGAVGRLGEVIELMDDPTERARVRLEIGQALQLEGRHGEAAAVFREGAAEAGPSEELRVRLSAAHATASRFSYAPGERLGPLVNGALGEPVTAATRELMAHVAFEQCLAGDSDAAATIKLAQEALDGGRLLEHEGPSAIPFYLAASALTFAEDLQAAELVLAVAVDEAQRKGSLFAFAMASFFRAMTVLRRGRLGDAADDLRAAQTAERRGWRFAGPATQALLAEAHLAKGEVDAAWHEIEQGSASQHDESPWLPFLLMVRGQVQDARGRSAAGLEDILRAGETAARLGARNPAVLPWRSAGAVVAARGGDGDMAVRLAREELELARAFGAPGAEARALRALGVVTEGADALDTLEQAVATADRSHAALERARARVELGAALRRARRRAAAREHLQAGADLAQRCGADALAARAREELVALGSRPRRLAVTGVEALTPRERQVVELAAEGLSNREIAGRLYVTLKTVEWHLRNGFEKLGVASRTDLKPALDEEKAGAS